MRRSHLFAQRIIARGLQRLGGDRPAEAFCVEKIVVSPEETAQRPAATALPGQIDRVKGTQSDTSMDHELARIQSCPVTHHPTWALRFRDVQYFDGVLYVKGWRRQQVVRPEPLWSNDPIDEIAECSLPGSTIGDRYFGHFLIDVSSTTLLSQRFAPPRLPRGTQRDEWSHAPGYQKLLGLEVPQIGMARVRDAWLFCDFGMTADRRDRLHELRRRVAARPARRGSHGVFIRRAGGQARNLLNEAEIEERLLREGFEIADPSQHDTDEMVAKIRGASVVCSVEGSAFAHGVLSVADRGALMVIQPPWRFNNLWKDFTDALDLRYGFVVAEGAKTEFRLDPDDLMRSLDLLGI